MSDWGHKGVKRIFVICGNKSKGLCEEYCILASFKQFFESNTFICFNSEEELRQTYEELEILRGERIDIHAFMREKKLSMLEEISKQLNETIEKMKKKEEGFKGR